MQQVLGPSSGPRSWVRMTKLKLLTLGKASVWVCDWEAAQTVNAGCAINCTEWEYQGVMKSFWLHIAYHALLDCGRGEITWQDRVLGAIRLVLRTLLRGEDVVVHGTHGPQMAKVVCESNASLSFNLKFRV